MDDHHRQAQTAFDEDQHTRGGKRRGPPYGSKNEPKPPFIITRESPNTLITHFLEIPPNHDIVTSLTDFTSTRQRALFILTATGSVTNLTLRKPPPPHQPSAKPSVLNFTGRFEIVSMSGAFLPPPAPEAALGMSVFVSGGGVQSGMVLGGKVVGKLMTAGVVSAFSNSPYDRLALGEDGEEVVADVEDEKVTLTEKIGTLIAKDRVNRQERQQLVTMMMNVSPGAPNAAIGRLLHGFGNNARNEMPAEEFWGDRPQLF